MSLGKAAAWIAGTSFAWAIFGFVTLMLYANNPVWQRAVVGAFAGAIFGALAGSAQWPLIRSRFEGAAWWVPATSFGWLCAGVLVPLMGEVIDRRVKIGLDYEVGIAAAGLVVGILQTFFYRGGRQKVIWLIFTLLAWGAAGFASWSLYETLTLGQVFDSLSVPGWTDQVAAEAASGLLGSVIGGLLVGVVTLFAFRASVKR